MRNREVVGLELEKEHGFHSIYLHACMCDLGVKKEKMLEVKKTIGERLRNFLEMLGVEEGANTGYIEGELEGGGRSYQGHSGLQNVG